MLVGACLLLTLAPGLQVSKLRTEYLTNPIGIGEKAPRFFWTLSSQQRGQAQTAYRVLVASSPQHLANGRGDLWDSGRVASHDTGQVEYKGRALKSRQRGWWTVQVWDKDGQKKAATPAFFEIGLLDRADWKAKWAGMPDPAEPELYTRGAKWIWYPEGEPQKDAPEGDRWFRKTVNLNRSGFVGYLGLAIDDDATVFVNGKEVLRGSGWTNYATGKVAGDNLKVGANEILIKAHNGHSRAGLLLSGSFIVGQPGSRAGQTMVPLVTDGSWETSINQSTWTRARALADIGGAPYGTPKLAAQPTPAIHLKKEVALSPTKKVKRARIYSSARGLYELYIDGRKVSEDIFRPGWTDYKKRIQYQTYDITNLLSKKPFQVEMIVGDGWYCGHVAWTGRQNYGPKPMGLAQVEIEYTDGEKQTIATGSDWSVQYGPILANDLLMGETYDARKEFADSGMKAATIRPDVQELGSVPIVWQPNEPVRVLDVIKPKKMSQPKAGTYVFDLGQNMVGWVRLRVAGPAGSTVTLRHAEMLNPDGTIYTTNLRRAAATDRYTLKGSQDSIEQWEPRFTFHGFRYVEVTGFPGVPSLESIRGVVIGSDSPQVGTLETSNKMLNQLQHNIFWGQRGNYLEAPTDCPQRDERLGWMGDAQIFVKTATFNNDIAAFMTKWTQDVEDGQSTDGSFADVSPRIGVGADGAPGWGDAGVIVPWTIYQVYGDKRLLSKRFKSMKKWVEMIEHANPDLIWRKRSGANYGDWLNVQDDTPREVVATAYFAHSADLVARAAGIVGDKEEAEEFNDLARRIRLAFNKEFVSPDGTVRGNTQTAYVLALSFGLVPNELPLAKKLAELIEVQRKGHLSTGFLGCGLIQDVLTRIGRSDLAYKLLLNEDYPGWLYSVKNGATTIWERWDGWTDTKGFQDPGMNSFNHYSFGAVGDWMYGSVGALDLGWQVTIAPNPQPAIRSAKLSYDSPRGAYKVQWNAVGKDITLDVTIPPGSSAKVVLPTRSLVNVRESGKKLGEAEGVTVSDGTLTIASGTYRFKAPLDR